MKRRHAPVDVETENGWPHRIQWNGDTYRVTRVLDAWVVQGRWWAREERRVYFCAWTDRCTFELYRSGEAWFVSKVFD